MRGANPHCRAGKRRVADTLGGEKLVVAGDDKAIGSEGIGGCVIRVQRRVEIEDATVFLGEATIPIEAQTGGQS